MNDYYIRCHPDNVAMLLALAVTLGVLRLDDESGEHLPAEPTTVWDVVGTIERDGQPVCAPDGAPYWHANLRMVGSLNDLAQQAYAANPSAELGTALAMIPDLFVVDEQGVVRMPAQPARVFL